MKILESKRFSCPCGEGEYEIVIYLSDTDEHISKNTMVCSKCVDRYIFHEGAWVKIEVNSNEIEHQTNLSYHKQTERQDASKTESKQSDEILEKVTALEKDRKIRNISNYVVVVAIILFVILIIWAIPNGLGDFLSNLFD